MSAAKTLKLYPAPDDDTPTVIKDIQENYGKGHVKIYRSIKKHWLWKASRKKTKMEAWLDLLLLAQYEDTKEPFGYDFVELKRGQLLTSQESLAKDWKWDRSAVRHFLLQLEKDEMIHVRSTSKFTVITICNYVSYHSKRPSADQVQTKSEPSGQHIQEREEYKEVKKGRKKAAPFVPPTLEEVKAYFKEHGYREDVAERAYGTYAPANWHDTKGNPVLNWKSKMNAVWFRDEHKATPTVPAYRNKNSFI